jgi:hypothetical protein
MLEEKPVDARVGVWTFDRAGYDARRDVLDLRHGASTRARKGTVSDFDDEGGVVGITIVNARWLMDREGGITVTLAPSGRMRATSTP